MKLLRLYGADEPLISFHDVDISLSSLQQEKACFVQRGRLGGGYSLINPLDTLF